MPLPQWFLLLLLLSLVILLPFDLRIEHNSKQKHFWFWFPLLETQECIQWYTGCETRCVSVCMSTTMYFMTAQQKYRYHQLGNNSGNNVDDNDDERRQRRRRHINAHIDLFLDEFFANPLVMFFPSCSRIPVSFGISIILYLSRL